MLTSICSETASSEARPKQPLPEDFGLTFERIRILREPVSVENVLENHRFWVGNAIMVLVGGAVAWESTQSVATASFIVFFGFFFCIFAVMVLVTAGIAAFSAIWRRFQPDHPQYVNYSRALADYHVRFFQWLRMQEFWWQSLDGRRFEVELAMVLGRLGYDVRCTGGAGDGGVDLVLLQAEREVIVQCKAHKNPIGPGPVRDLYGTMIHRNVCEAWLVTANGFSQAALEFAHGKGIRLLTVRQLLKADRPLDSWQDKVTTGATR